MNCPQCKTPTVADQQFCRSCGTALMGEPPRRINLRTWGLIALLLAFGGVFAAMSGKMFDLRWLIFAGTFIMLTGAFILLIVAFLYDTRPRKGRINPAPNLEPLSSSDATNRLLPIGNNDYIPSVTEKTTDLLKTPIRESKNFR
jgi:hypothetical protein